MKQKRLLLDQAAIGRALTRIAHEIVERNQGVQDVLFVGIATRGLPIAHRLAQRIEKIEGQLPPVLTLDVTPYRDDLNTDSFTKVEDPTPSNLEQRTLVHAKRIVIVDDVLYTGRTVRAAMDALTDGARPAQIQLAVLVDRGHRELPIRPDYVGKNIPTARGEEVEVHVAEVDGEDAVMLWSQAVDDKNK